jgi:hypothetical protein
LTKSKTKRIYEPWVAVWDFSRSASARTQSGRNMTDGRALRSAPPNRARGLNNPEVSRAPPERRSFKVTTITGTIVCQPAYSHTVPLPGASTTSRPSNDRVETLLGFQGRRESHRHDILVGTLGQFLGQGSPEATPAPPGRHPRREAALSDPSKAK